MRPVESVIICTGGIRVQVRIAIKDRGQGLFGGADQNQRWDTGGHGLFNLDGHMHVPGDFQVRVPMADQPGKKSVAAVRESVNAEIGGFIDHFFAVGGQAGSFWTQSKQAIG